MTKANKIEGAPIDLAAGKARLQAMTEERNARASEPANDVVEAVQSGPIHRSSVLGYTLYSMGLDPQQHGEIVLDVSATGISRILTGARPTPLGLMRRLEPFVDALQRRPDHLRPPVPFLCQARALLALEPSLRGRKSSQSDQSLVTHPSRVERSLVMSGFHPVFDDLDGDGELIMDSAGLFGACCRIVGWSALDLADALDVSVSQARRLIEGRDSARASDWGLVFLQYDEEIADPESPVGVGIRWARHQAEREDLEVAYAIGDGVPVLFVDDNEEE